MGAKNVVITDGENGAYVESEKNEAYHLGIIKTEIVEKTGAGDAFSAGFLAAIIYGLGIPEAMTWGTINSASVIGKIGSQEGLLTKLEMEKKLVNNNLKTVMI